MTRGSTRFAAILCVGTLVALGMASCNAISGVDDYQFNEGSGGAGGSASSSSGAGASGSSTSSSGSGGSGGMASCGVLEKLCDGTCRSYEDPAFGCGDPFCQPCNVLGGMETCCFGLCADTAVDPLNCGQCDNECDKEKYCQSGACVCRPGLTLVMGSCVNLKSDPQNCGAVGMTCDAPTPLCEAGKCVTSCGIGYSSCGNHCVDKDTDPEYCGDCFGSCDADELCNGGDCDTWIPGSSVGCSSCPCPSCPTDYQCTTYPGTAMTICVKN